MKIKLFGILILIFVCTSSSFAQDHSSFGKSIYYSNIYRGDKSELHKKREHLKHDRELLNRQRSSIFYNRDSYPLHKDSHLLPYTSPRDFTRRPVEIGTPTLRRITNFLAYTGDDSFIYMEDDDPFIWRKARIGTPTLHRSTNIFTHRPSDSFLRERREIGTPTSSSLRLGLGESVYKRKISSKSNFPSKDRK